MAKGVGLDIGEYEIKVVELDGSLKKPRLTKVNIDLAESAPGPDAAVADVPGRAVLHVLKDAGLGRDNISVAFPCREAVLRTISVPFVGEENIRKVLKFEVEGSIHSHNVDDMVIDFVSMEASASTTKVMVVAVPKPSLRTRLKSLEAVGIEPENVDLDATALYRTAECIGCFSEPIDGAEPPAEGEPPRARLVIDVGARSAAVLLVVGGRLLDLRTLRTGTDAVVDEIVAAHQITPAIARKLALEALQTGEDQGYAITAPADAAGAPEAEAAAAAAAVAAPQESLSHAFVAGARDRFLERFRRELMRFIASVSNVGAIEAVWITGGGSLMPGVADVIGEVCGCQPRMLDVLGRLQHGLNEEEAAAINPRIAVAVGLALGMMGGPLRLNFRREDLAFARQFDRLKFPLAVTCMLGLFFCVFLGLRNLKQLGYLESEYGTTTMIPPEERKGGAPVRFAGVYVQRLMAPTGWMDQRMERRAYTQLCERLANADTFKQLDMIRAELEKLKKSEQEKTGYYADLALESGFAVLVRMSQVLKSIEGQLGRYLITDIRMELPPNGSRYVEIVFALRRDFRTIYDAIKQAFADDARDAASPFAKVGEAIGVEKLFSDLEPGEEGAYMTLKVDVKPTFGVFQDVSK